MAERMMRLFADEAEPRRLIDAARGDQDVVGPQGELAVAELSRASDAGGDQPAPDASAAGAWLDIEQPEFRDRGIVALHQENRAEDRAAALGDPGVLAGGIEFGDERPEDAAGEPLVSPIPAVFLGVEDRLAMDDPTDVANPQRPQIHLPGRRLAVPQRPADVAHRLDEAVAPAGVDRFEQGVDLRSRPGLGRGEDPAARVGQQEQPMLAMVRADPACRQPSRDEARHDAAQMRLVHA